MDVSNISPVMDYSLHTEYSAMRRRFDSPFLEPLIILKEAQRGKVPCLWWNEGWSYEFCNFIIKLVGWKNPPTVIEIHPPFTDYCETIEDFLGRYSFFEREIKSIFPDTIILLENRCGTIYTRGNFLVSNCASVLRIVEGIVKRNLKLKIVLDIPQLFSAHSLTGNNMSEVKIQKLLRPLRECHDYIAGIHIWGRKKRNNRAVAHMGNLDDLFGDKKELKNVFLHEVFELLNDQRPRYFIPEVNSSDEDSISIVRDFLDFGFRFI